MFQPKHAICTPPSCLQDLSLEGLSKAKEVMSEAAERLWCVVFGWPGLATGTYLLSGP